MHEPFAVLLVLEFRPATIFRQLAEFSHLSGCAPVAEMEVTRIVARKMVDERSQKNRLPGPAGTQDADPSLGGLERLQGHMLLEYDKGMFELYGETSSASKRRR